MESVNLVVSVVIPIYKTELYLDKCIESIVNQTYKNLEIILVDDASPDRCPEICNTWARTDERIKVIHKKKNEGLGMARNTGIDNAHGNYIYFIDSDDHIKRNTIEECLQTATLNNADIVYFGSYGFHRAGKKIIITENIPRLEKYIYKGNEIRDELFPELISSNPNSKYKNNMDMSAWMQLISMKLIRDCNWKFISEREVISEDICSFLELYRAAQKVVVLKKAYYYGSLNSNSITKTYNEKQLEKIKKFYEYCISKCDEFEYNEETKKRLEINSLGKIIAHFKNVVNSKESLRKKISVVRNDINDKWMHNLVKNNIHIKNSIQLRIIFTLMYLRLPLCVYIITRLKTKKENVI